MGSGAFGLVWPTTSTHLKITLKNTCNLQNTVQKLTAIIATASADTIENLSYYSLQRRLPPCPQHSEASIFHSSVVRPNAPA
jgi:hypothetical protein